LSDSTVLLSQNVDPPKTTIVTTIIIAKIVGDRLDAGLLVGGGEAFEVSLEVGAGVES
jgi:hypothetical protein